MHPKALSSRMVYTWASKGLPYLDVEVCVCSIGLPGTFCGKECVDACELKTGWAGRQYPTVPTCDQAGELEAFGCRKWSQDTVNAPRKLL